MSPARGEGKRRVPVALNLPNMLTLCRVAAVPVVLVLLTLAPQKPGRDGSLLYTCSLALTFAAGVTDAFDGYLARNWKQITRFGRFTDPVADKLLATGVFVILVEKHALPGWVAAVILSREFAVMALRMILSSEGIAVEVSRWAKIKTIFQMAALVAILVHLSLQELGGGGWVAMPYAVVTYFGYLAQASLWLALLLTMTTGYTYFRANWAHLET